MILPETDLKQALVLADRIRVAACGLDTPEQVTLSIGVGEKNRLRQARRSYSTSRPGSLQKQRRGKKYGFLLNDTHHPHTEAGRIFFSGFPFTLAKVCRHEDAMVILIHHLGLPQRLLILMLCVIKSCSCSVRSLRRTVLVIVIEKESRDNV